MSVYEVSSVTGPKPWQRTHGTMWGYVLEGTLDGKPQKASVNTKENGKAPFVGESFSCDVSGPDTGYGVKLKRSMLPPHTPAGIAATAQAVQNAQEGRPIQRNDSYVPDDEKQRMIVRQSSLKAALEYCAIKIPLLGKEDKEKFDADMVISLSEKFSRYALSGKNPSPRSAIEVLADGEPPYAEEDPSEIPFP